MIVGQIDFKGFGFNFHCVFSFNATENKLSIWTSGVTPLFSGFRGQMSDDRRQMLKTEK
jgi:hypothetical protein